MSDPPVDTVLTARAVTCRCDMETLCKRARADLDKMLLEKVVAEQDEEGPYHRLNGAALTHLLEQVQVVQAVCAFRDNTLKTLASVDHAANAETVAALASSATATFHDFLSHIAGASYMLKRMEAFDNVVPHRRPVFTDAMLLFLRGVLQCEESTQPEVDAACTLMQHRERQLRDIVRLGGLRGLVTTMEATTPQRARTLCFLCLKWWRNYPPARFHDDAERTMHALVTVLRAFPRDKRLVRDACQALQAFTSELPSNQALLMRADGLHVLLRTLLATMHNDKHDESNDIISRNQVVVSALKALWNAVFFIDNAVTKDKAIELGAVDVLLEVCWWLRNRKYLPDAKNAAVACQTLRELLYKASSAFVLVNRGGLCEVINMARLWPSDCAVHCNRILRFSGIPRARASALIAAVTDPKAPHVRDNAMEDEAKGEEETKREALAVATCFAVVAQRQGPCSEYSHPRLRRAFPASPFIEQGTRLQALKWLRDGIARPGPPSPTLMAAVCVLAAVLVKDAEEALLHIDPELQLAMGNLVCADVLPPRVLHRIFLSIRNHGRKCFWGLHFFDALHKSPKLSRKYAQLKARYKAAMNDTTAWVIKEAMSL